MHYVVGITDEEPKKKKSALDIVRGGIDDKDESQSTNEQEIPTDLAEKEKKKIQWIQKAREISLSKENEDEFFTQNGLVLSIGLSTQIRIRLGFCDFHNVNLYYIVAFEFNGLLVFLI